MVIKYIQKKFPDCIVSRYPKRIIYYLSLAYLPYLHQVSGRQVFNLLSLIFNLRLRLPKCLSALVPLVSLILLLSSLILSCSNSSKPDENITVSGTVTLEGRTDHSGVKVSLYKPVELDTTLVRINQQYPNIGVQISQETEFDHREHEAVYATTSKSDGSWKIESVNLGIYNIVAEKDSFDLKYLYEEDISDRAINILLKKAIYLQGYINQEIKIKDMTVNMNDLTINDNGRLEISGHSCIVLNEQSKVLVKGELNIVGTADALIRVISYKNFKWNLLQIDNGAYTKIEFAIIKDCINGLYNKSNNLTLNQIVFTNNDIALSNFDIQDTLDISNCIFRYNNLGIDNFAIQNLRLRKNIFYKNVTGVHISSNQSSSLPTFSHFTSNILIADEQSVKIDWPISTTYKVNSVLFNYNSFVNSNGCIQTGVIKDVTANFNNFINIINNFVEIRDQSKIPDTLNFHYNYWGSFSESQIKDKIIDSEDNTAFSIYVDVKEYISNIIDINPK